MAVVQTLGIDGEGGFRIPDDEIRIATNCDGAFSLFNSGKTRGIFAEPICHVRNRIASRAGLRPDGREAELE